jgi:CspA family cold shock protein
MSVQMDERERGVVKWFNDKKGYGFISRESGKDIFVHHSSILSDGFRSLKDGDPVEFSVKQDDKGLAAVDVRKV